MDKIKAIEVIEDLRDYAYENWDDAECANQLDEIGEAVDFIKQQLAESKNVRSMEVYGKKYLIFEV